MFQDSVSIGYSVKNQNFSEFPGLEVLWKHIVSVEFRAIRPKLHENCAFPQKCHIKKLSKILVFYALYRYDKFDILNYAS